MKLHKIITVAGREYPLISEDVRLNLMTPGRAVFTVEAGESLSGIVVFSLGFDPNDLNQFFLGYVESSTALDGKQQRLFCRELTATLNRPLPLSLRNVTLNGTLEKIAEDTGLEFVTPREQYSQAPAPAFYSMGGGYHCMDSLAQVFDIPQMIWQQQGNGQVYVGSWQHSYWANRPVEIETKWLTGFGNVNRARVPALPKLRPGVFFNEGNYITQVQLDGSHMLLTWNQNPWSVRL